MNFSSYYRWVLCFLFSLLAMQSWAESISVLGLGKDTFYVYDEFGRDYKGNAVTNKKVTVTAGTYRVQLNNYLVTVTVAAGQNLTLTAGSLTVEGIGLDRFFVYDEFERNYSAGLYTNQIIELLPDIYSIQLNSVFQKATVQAGQKTTLPSGRLSVAGRGVSDFSIYDQYDKNRIVSSIKTNKQVELFTGDYIVRLTNSVQKTSVKSGQKTVLTGGSLVVTGLGLAEYTVYDEFDKNRLSNITTTTNQETELFEGNYIVYLHNVAQKVTVKNQQKTLIPTTAVKMNIKGSGSLRNAETDKQLLCCTTFYEQAEFFTGKYIVKIDKEEQEINVQSALPSFVAFDSPVTPTTPPTETPSTIPTNPPVQTYADGIKAGMEQCKTNPSSCGIVVTANNDGSTQEGINQCKQNPISCGITVNQNSDGSTQAGINQCQANPSSCGIIVTANNDGSTQAGINQCKQNPASCDITVNQNIDGSIQEGIKQCQANPASCNIIVLDEKTVIQTTIERCKRDPISCNIQTIAETEKVIYNPQLGHVHIPRIFISDNSGKNLQYEIFLLQRPNVFTFDLDFSRIKQK